MGMSVLPAPASTLFGERREILNSWGHAQNISFLQDDQSPCPWLRLCFFAAPGKSHHPCTGLKDKVGYVGTSGVIWSHLLLSVPQLTPAPWGCVRPQMLWVQHLPKDLACIKLYIKHLKWGQTQHLGCSAFPTKKVKKNDQLLGFPLTLGSRRRSGLGWTGVGGRLLGHHTAEAGGTSGGWLGGWSHSCLFPMVVLFVFAETSFSG